MDHAIEAVKMHLEPELDFLKEEWSSGEYKKLSDCPTYSSAKAMVDAIHVMEKYYYGEHKTLSVKDLVI